MMTRHEPKLGLAEAVHPIREERPGSAVSPLVAQEADAERPLRSAALRGWRQRCPCCGRGPMMRGYLKVRDVCPVCEEELHHQRADDGPAYLTILIVGHVMAPLLLASFTAFRPDPLVLGAVFSIGTVALSLFLLPRLKGMLVGIQWARRMHGFGVQQAG
jgi:uncharacterized protein (DUF983 family)